MCQRGTWTAHADEVAAWCWKKEEGHKAWGECRERWERRDGRVRWGGRVWTVGRMRMRMWRVVVGFRNVISLWTNASEADVG
jgi:hypothetical protein